MAKAERKRTEKQTPARRKRRVQFAFEAPQAKDVKVTGSFCGWQEGYAMKKDSEGLWKTSVLLEPGRHEYRFLVDGEWRNDPRASERVRNEFGSENDVLEVAGGR